MKRLKTNQELQLEPLKFRSSVLGVRVYKRLKNAMNFLLNFSHPILTKASSIKTYKRYAQPENNLSI